MWKVYCSNSRGPALGVACARARTEGTASAGAYACNTRQLKGKLLLSVGEVDPNVDPASTMQVVSALIKANKMFDLLVLPGRGIRWAGAERAGEDGAWVT